MTRAAGERKGGTDVHVSHAGGNTASIYLLATLPLCLLEIIFSAFFSHLIFYFPFFPTFLLSVVISWSGHTTFIRVSRREMPTVGLFSFEGLDLI
jgi:hypothetical protein